MLYWFDICPILVTHFGNKNKKAKQYKKVDVNIEFKSKLGKVVMQQVKK